MLAVEVAGARRRLDFALVGIRSHRRAASTASLNICRIILHLQVVSGRRSAERIGGAKSTPHHSFHSRRGVRLRLREQSGRRRNGRSHRGLDRASGRGHRAASFLKAVFLRLPLKDTRGTSFETALRPAEVSQEDEQWLPILEDSAAPDRLEAYVDLGTVR